MGCTESHNGKGGGCCFKHPRLTSSQRRKLTAESSAPIHVAPKSRTSSADAKDKRIGKESEKEKEKEKDKGKDKGKDRDKEKDTGKGKKKESKEKPKEKSNSKSKRSSSHKKASSKSQYTKQQEVCCCHNKPTNGAFDCGPSSQVLGPSTSQQTLPSSSSKKNGKDSHSKKKKKFFFGKEKKDTSNYPKMPGAPVFEPVVPTSLRHNYVTPVDQPTSNEGGRDEKATAHTLAESARTMTMSMAAAAAAAETAPASTRVTWAENTTSSEAMPNISHMNISAGDQGPLSTPNMSLFKLTTDVGVGDSVLERAQSNETPRGSIGPRTTMTKQQQSFQGGLGVLQENVSSLFDERFPIQFVLVTASNATSEQRAYARLMGYDLLTDRQIHNISYWVDDTVSVLKKNPVEALPAPVYIPGSASNVTCTSIPLLFPDEGGGGVERLPGQPKLTQEEAESYGLTIPGTSQVSAVGVNAGSDAFGGITGGGAGFGAHAAAAAAVAENAEPVSLTVENMTKHQRELAKENQKFVSFGVK